MIGVLAGCERRERQEKYDDQLGEKTASRASKLDVCMRARIYFAVLPVLR